MHKIITNVFDKNRKCYCQCETKCIERWHTYGWLLKKHCLFFKSAKWGNPRDRRGRNKWWWKKWWRKLFWYAPGEKLSRFLKMRVFLGHSFIIIKWTWGFFPQHLQFDPPPTITHNGGGGGGDFMKNSLFRGGADKWKCVVKIWKNRNCPTSYN